MNTALVALALTNVAAVYAAVSWWRAARKWEYAAGKWREAAEAWESAFKKVGSRH